jgi:CheY-like chemotaxis protein
MGLGLAVSYGIICRHEGTVEVESEVGRGTTFVIKLPIAKAVAGTTPVAEMVQAPAPTQAASRILIVDDEDYIRELLRDILESQGNVIVEAQDAYKALEILKSESFDAMFTDIGMPGMSGWDLVAAVRKMDAQLPIAILTGWGESLSADEQETHEVQWVVAKPFTMERVAEIVTEISESKRGRTRHLTLVA